MEGAGEAGEEGLKGTLDQFVAEWRQELLTFEPGGGLLGKREGRSKEEKGSTSGSEGEGGEAPVEKRPAPREPAFLLVLPAGRGGDGQRVSALKREADSTRTQPPSLVDTLIADLDEINTIPFFEVQLPREVALLVFSHLSMADLCTCALVSRSWHSLAEDNVLWSQICRSMGYTTSLQEGSHVMWKAVVKEIVLRKKKQLRNWKERICGLSELQPDTEGVLLCADFCLPYRQLLAGYSSGAVYVWTLTSEEGPVTLETGHTHPATPISCRISQGWAAVATQQGDVSVYDSDVGSLVHRVGGLGHVACLDLQWTQACLTVGVACTRQLYRPGEASPTQCSEVTVLTCQEGRDWQTLVIRPHQDHTPIIISQLAVLGPSLLYSTQCSLSLHPIPSPSPSSLLPPPTPTHILTSAGSAGSTVINCFDHTPQTVACATSAWGYHVQLYDLCTAGHMTTLRGHTQPVTALNIHSSPPNTLVSGSADKRVRMFDTRSSQPVLTLSGHHGTVTSVQCDDWKATSGGKDGLVVIWDRRMAAELWSSHERHAVGGCWFDSRYLVAAHLPERGVWSLQTANQSEPLHRRQRGLLRVMDFSVDPLYHTRLLPSVCSSGYDEPSRSLYHLDLKFPYDIIS